MCAVIMLMIVCLDTDRSTCESEQQTGQREPIVASWRLQGAGSMVMVAVGGAVNGTPRCVRKQPNRTK